METGRELRGGERVPTAVHQAAEAQLVVFSYPMDHKHQVVDPRLLACIMYIPHVSCTAMYMYMYGG